MSLLLTLYWIFFKIGLFTFGGGYAMLPLMEAEIIARQGWLTHPEFIDIIAVAEATPGPVAINSATYVGFQVAGIPGSLLATLGVISPSLLLLLVLGPFLLRWIKDPRVQRFTRGLRPAVIALILLAAISLGRAALVDWSTLIIAAGLLGLRLLRRTSPLITIALGALLGLLLYPY
ncbi:MAG TPA: chromate transporter [Bacillota bacterium]|jgi:chromate transporter|nr:chromate transporter [Bacillota bacterium]HOB87226.1 chromate transporter [Bacillota bacterium]HOP68340.1 chromate transporter [Bacillota bacterium]HPT33491.1 chromate transporter [Bacillota bacterium]HPZ65126.1 chromate transporter [Bacillota bacterium]